MKRDMDGGALRRVARMNVHDYSVRATLDIIGDGMCLTFAVATISC